MTAYAIAHLRTVELNEEIVDYILRIDKTLPPYEGRFLVHGTHPQVMDGDLPGDLVIIEFPDTARAHAWYGSPGYQAILPLRVRTARAAPRSSMGCQPATARRRSSPRSALHSGATLGGRPRRAHPRLFPSPATDAVHSSRTTLVGSSCGCSSMAEHQLPKLTVRVRSPSPALVLSQARGLFCFG